ncbi:MAG TPA: sensor histidine kinase [Hyphomicrobiaceae bacterium]|nr:sensor histidine kinase [Hyphomicrobiaceae bacterium]
MRLNSLAFRLIATSAAWTLLVLPIAGIIIYRLYREDMQTRFDDLIEKFVNAVAVDSMGSGGPEPVAPTNRYEPLFEETHSGWYWQIKPLDNPSARRLVSASLATATLESPFEKNVPPDESGTRWMNSTGPVGEPIRMVEVLDTNDHIEGGPRYSVVVAGPIEWLEGPAELFRQRLTIALALTGLGLVGVTLFQVRFGLLPLRRIEQGLAAVRSGEASRLEGEPPSEIKPLQQELNALIQSNQDIVDRARTQVGNLAHALKTPLAVITNEAREDPGGLGAKVAEQARLMRDQVNYYLDRARVAARVGIIGRSTVIAPVAFSLARALERIHYDRDLRISVECAPDLRFQGERQDLEEMLGNLLDNACKWARKNVLLTVSPTAVEKPPEPRRAIITVEDDGPGLSEDERARIGKRGLRLDETKPGSGLGLSIVTDLVQSYRGSLELGRSARGGLSVRLDLPAA